MLKIKERKLSPCEIRLANYGVDVYTHEPGDEDEFHWRGTLIDRMETKIINLTVDIKELVAQNLELQAELEKMKKHG